MVKGSIFRSEWKCSRASRIHVSLTSITKSTHWCWGSTLSQNWDQRVVWPARAKWWVNPSSKTKNKPISSTDTIIKGRWTSRRWRKCSPLSRTPTTKYKPRSRITCRNKLIKSMNGSRWGNSDQTQRVQSLVLLRYGKVFRLWERKNRCVDKFMLHLSKLLGRTPQKAHGIHNRSLQESIRTRYKNTSWTQISYLRVLLIAISHNKVRMQFDVYYILLPSLSIRLSTKE